MSTPFPTHQNNYKARPRRFNDFILNRPSALRLLGSLALCSLVLCSLFLVLDSWFTNPVHANKAGVRVAILIS